MKIPFCWTDQLFIYQRFLTHLHGPFLWFGSAVKSIHLLAYIQHPANTGEKLSVKRRKWKQRFCPGWGKLEVLYVILKVFKMLIFLTVDIKNNFYCTILGEHYKLWQLWIITVMTGVLHYYLGLWQEKRLDFFKI